MRRQPRSPGITLVLALIGAGMSEGQNIARDLPLCLIPKSSGMNAVRTVRKFAVSLLAALGDQLQVTLRVGLAGPFCCQIAATEGRWSANRSVHSRC